MGRAVWVGWVKEEEYCHVADLMVARVDRTEGDTTAMYRSLLVVLVVVGSEFYVWVVAVVTRLVANVDAEVSFSEGCHGRSSSRPTGSAAAEDNGWVVGLTELDDAKIVSRTLVKRTRSVMT